MNSDDCKCLPEETIEIIKSALWDAISFSEHRTYTFNNYPKYSSYSKDWISHISKCK